MTSPVRPDRRWPVRFAAAASGLVLAAGLGPIVDRSPAYADDARAGSWYVDSLKLAQAHQVTQGDGVVVAVIDTGVDPNQPDLTGNVLPGIDMQDPDRNASQGWQDTDGHGTAMAALIAGHGHGSDGRDGILGIAPRAKILPIDVFDSQPGAVAPNAAPGAINAAIRLATDRGADVICIANSGSYSPGENEAVRYATDHNVVVVAAAGNPPSPIVGSPAVAPFAVAVTAIGRDGKPFGTVRGLPDREIDIAAPGVGLMVPRRGGGYYSTDGTSLSTALTSGALALVRAKYPDANRDQLVQRIIWTADDAGDPGYDWVFGWGSVNLVEALTGQLRPPPSNTAPPAPSGGQVLPPVPPIDNTGAELLGLAVLIIGVLVLAGIVVGIVAFLRRRRVA